MTRADGSGERNLTENPTSNYSPAWSPDGTMIEFASDRDGDPNEIYVIDADGSNPTRITDQPGSTSTRRGRPTAPVWCSTARWAA